MELHCLFFGLFLPPSLLIPHLHLIGFFFSSCLLLTWCCSVDCSGRSRSPPLKGSLIEVLPVPHVKEKFLAWTTTSSQ